MSGLVKIGTFSEIAPGQIKGFVTNAKRILVVNIDGGPYAIGSICTHLGGPLERRKLGGRIVTCPWLGSRFDVADGKVVGGPAANPESTYRVNIEGVDILIEMT